jgi:hypothetical protein
MVACAEILTAERRARKLRTRRAIGVEIDGYRYDTSSRRNLWANWAGGTQILPRAARLHACSHVYFLLSPFCRCSRPVRDPIGYRGGINLYGYVNSSPVGNVDAGGEIWIDGTNLSPPSPAPPRAPKKCCPPFPPLVNAWKRWVADYLEAKAMYSALASQQRFAHGIGNGYDTVLAEYQNAKDTILIGEIYLQSVKLLARFGDIEILPAELLAEAKINRLKAQNRTIGGDVANLEGMYARSVPPFVEVTNYIKQLRKVGRAQGDYIEFSYYCG